MYIRTLEAIVLALAKSAHFGKHKLKHKLSVGEIVRR